MKDKVKFAILADFHQSMFPDSDEKIKQFIEAVNNDKEIEFVVDLGDLCFPIAKKKGKLQFMQRLKIFRMDINI